MKKYTLIQKARVILIVTVALMSLAKISFQIKPIEVGTFLVPIPIPSKYEVTLQSSSQSLVGATVVAGMTKMYFPEQVMFQFTYKLNPNKRLIEFFFQKGPGQILELSIDYLVGKQINSEITNMTSFQHHISHSSPGINQYADVLLLYLNGFSRLDITGNVTYLYISQGQVYTVHYMNGMNHQSTDPSHSPDWGDNFILYNVIYIENKTIQSTCASCIVRQYFHIRSQITSLQQPNIDSFFGLKGYAGNEFKAEFVYSSTDNHAHNVFFTFDKQISNYNDWKQASIASVYLTGDFIDKRNHRIVAKISKPASNLIENGTVFVIVGLIIAFAVLAGVGIYFWKCHKLKSNGMMNNQSEIISEITVNVEKQSKTEKQSHLNEDLEPEKAKREQTAENDDSVQQDC